MEQNTLLMPFLDESENFTNGFECGQFWQRINEGEIFERQLFHTKNKEQIEMICRSFGVESEIIEYDDEWSYCTIKPII